MSTLEWIWFVLLSVLFLILVEVWRSAHTLGLTRLELPIKNLPSDFEGFKICHLSDFHSTNFVENDALLESILKEKPDVIVVTGDMADCKKDPNSSDFFVLLDQLEGKIPCYCSLGNHELRIGRGKPPVWLCNAIEEAGCTVLDNRGVALNRGNSRLYLYGYLQPLEDVSQRRIRTARLRQDVTACQVDEALGPCPQDAPVVLLAHDPSPFPAYAKWGAALTLSGHIHGGMIRLPLVGGVVSPNRALFPKYDAGLFESAGRLLYVSRGLGESMVPRFFNTAEAVFLTLHQDHGKNT